MAAPNIQKCASHVLTGIEAISAPNESSLCQEVAAVLIVNNTQAAYDELGRQFRADLYVTRQARPLLAAQSSVAAPARE
jgi:hypothetical protein